MMAAATLPLVNHARRFGGVSRLYGAVGAARIFSSHVVVVGVGGVGSWSAEALARSGVGHITLIDLDHVSESNINRQIHSLDATLGQSKIEAMRERIKGIHPQGQVHLIDDFVTPENWTDMAAQIHLLAPIDAVIDACDQVAAKTALAAWAKQHPTVSFVTVGAAGGQQQAQAVQLDDLSNVTHDPLLAKLRYNLRRRHGAARGGKMGVLCVYSQEPTRQPSQMQQGTACEVEADTASDGSLNCHGFGSSVAVTATFGMCAAGEILQQLAASA